MANRIDEIASDAKFQMKDGFGIVCTVASLKRFDELLAYAKDAEARIRELEAALLWTMEEWFGDDALASLGEKISLAKEGPEPVRELVERAQQTSAVRRIAESETTRSTMNYGGVGQVGCERADGTLNIHSANETCAVCAPRISTAMRNVAGKLLPVAA